jgi:uncharacterized FlaG/YvyC family protein
MASDVSPGAISGASAVLSSQAADPAKFALTSGKTLPSGGNSAATAAATAASIAAAGKGLPQSGNGAAQPTATAPAANSNSTTASTSSAKSSQAKSTAASSSDPQALVNQINKYLNDSGQADQFRLDPSSENYIQQVNPANGAVVAQYAVSEFPALARSIGVSGLLIDDVA